MVHQRLIGIKHGRTLPVHHAASIATLPAMTTTPDATIRQRLITRRNQLREQLTNLRGGPLSRVEASADHFARSQDSVAETSAERELEYALDARESAELNDIQAALDRLASGRYGLCVDCGEAIAAARLAATPEVARCVPCQEAAERPAILRA